MLRGIAIISVISIHISSCFKTMQISPISMIYLSINCFSHFAVPCFIIITGFVLFNKYKHFNKKDAIQFYNVHLPFLVIPYLTFSILFLIERLVVSRFLQLPFIPIQGIVYNFFTGSMWYHLWFFVLILQLYLIYPISICVFNRLSTTFLKFGLYFVLYIFSISFFLFRDLFTHIPGINLNSLFMNLPVIGYLPFLFIGMEFNCNYIKYCEILVNLNSNLKKKSMIYLFVLISLSMYCLYYGYMYLPIIINFNPAFLIFLLPLLFIIVSIFFLNICSNITRDSRISMILNRLGDYSFGIYLIHPIILLILDQIIKIGTLSFIRDFFWYYPVLMITCISLSFYICKIIILIPYGKNMIGVKGYSE